MRLPLTNWSRDFIASTIRIPETHFHLVTLSFLSFYNPSIHNSHPSYHLTTAIIEKRRIYHPSRGLNRESTDSSHTPNPFLLYHSNASLARRQGQRQQYGESHVRPSHFQMVIKCTHCTMISTRRMDCRVIQQRSVRRSS